MHSRQIAFLAVLLGCGGDATGPSEATVAAVSVTSTLSSVEVGKTLQFSVSVTDAGQKAIAGMAVEWQTSDASVATVGDAGLVTGVATGQATITASAGGKSGGKVVTVGPAVAAVTISGATSVQAGSTTKLTATPKDGAGNAMSGVTVQWTSSDVATISVASDGTVTGNHIGAAVITATAGSASASVNFTSGLTPFTFNLAGASAADALTIKDGVQNAHAFHLATFGRQVKEATTVSALTTPTGGCAQGGSAAFTGLHSVTFCLGNPGWTQNGPIQRQKIVQHETFHVWQFEYKWLGNPSTAGATWAIEGSAELMGWQGIIAKGLTNYQTAIGCQVKQVADFTQGLPPLSNVEAQQQFATTVGPIYAQSMLAMDQLTTNGGGLAVLKTYGDAIAAGTDWHSAFQTAFGMSTSAFYSQFPAYRSSQAVPIQYLCGF
jgi:hypothetical protein